MCRGATIRSRLRGISCGSRWEVVGGAGFSTAGEARPRPFRGQASPWRESDGVASLQAKA